MYRCTTYNFPPRLAPCDGANPPYHPPPHRLRQNHNQIALTLTRTHDTNGHGHDDETPTIPTIPPTKTTTTTKTKTTTKTTIVTATVHSHPPKPTNESSAPYKSKTASPPHSPHSASYSNQPPNKTPLTPHHHPSHRYGTATRHSQPSVTPGISKGRFGCSGRCTGPRCSSTTTEVTDIKGQLDILLSVRRRRRSLRTPRLCRGRWPWVRRGWR